MDADPDPEPPMRPTAASLQRDPNVVPMIDVLLVLLIAFILFALERRTAIDLQLPVPAEGSVAPEPPIVLEVLPGPAYRLNQESVAPDRLAPRLAAVFAGRPTRVLFVKGDPAVRYQEVITALDAARGAGVRVSGVVPPSR